MTLALEWTGQDEFAAEPLRDWQVEDEVAGVTRSAGPFTFATIYGAGHMVRWTLTYRPKYHAHCCCNKVPYDKPKESLEMVKRWLAGEEL